MPLLSCRRWEEKAPHWRAWQRRPARATGFSHHHGRLSPIRDRECLQEQILAAFSAVTPDQPATLEAASSQIGQLFAQHVMPGEIAEEILCAYADLGAYAGLGASTNLGEGDIPVAVRSSATAEDLPGMSFGGQQETYLNIRGVEAVLEAVRKCWASLWTTRAIGYRPRQNIASESVALAVVVQVFVPAEAAGILFTANPLIGRRDETVINAAWGLLVPAPLSGEFTTRFAVHLAEFGHITYDLDFMNPIPADYPIPLLDALKVYLSGQGNNPRARQQAQGMQRKQAEQAIFQRIGSLRRKWFQKLLDLAQEYAIERENAIANIGLPYPQLRRLLRELGQRLAAGGAIAPPEDLYWLEGREVDALASALEMNAPFSNHIANVEARKVAWKQARKAAPPPILPENSWLAKMMAPKKSPQNTLKGKGTSAGVVTARACVLRGPEDFGQMHPGDVLVAVATTPAWTPLFAMASAVVADIGEALSHSSILAREYGIPAVMATGSGTRRISSGQIITVDGSKGLVTLMK
jgi:phosphohistidine swiveling domain-containing protein